MGPSTMSQIAAICSRIGLPSFAIRVGLVVTPSTMPHSAPFRISSRFAVSRKNFIWSQYIEAGGKRVCRSQQLLILRLCLLEYRDVAIRVSPESEEILIG